MFEMQKKKTRPSRVLKNESTRIRRRLGVELLEDRRLLTGEVIEWQLTAMQNGSDLLSDDRVLELEVGETFELRVAFNDLRREEERFGFNQLMANISVGEVTESSENFPLYPLMSPELRFFAGYAPAIYANQTHIRFSYFADAEDWLLGAEPSESLTLPFLYEEGDIKSNYAYALEAFGIEDYKFDRLPNYETTKRLGIQFNPLPIRVKLGETYANMRSPYITFDIGEADDSGEIRWLENFTSVSVREAVWSDVNLATNFESSTGEDRSFEYDNWRNWGGTFRPSFGAPQAAFSRVGGGFPEPDSIYYLDHDPRSLYPGGSLSEPFDAFGLKVQVVAPSEAINVGILCSEETRRMDGTVNQYHAGNLHDEYNVPCGDQLVGPDASFVAKFLPAPPIASNDSFSILEDENSNFDVLANDKIPFDEPVSVSVLGLSTQGIAVEVDGNGNVVYKPPANFFGKDEFVYEVSTIPARYTHSATVTVDVAPVNDTPVADAGGPYESFEGAFAEFDASGSFDIDGDALSYRWDFDGDGSWDTDFLDQPTVANRWADEFEGRVSLEVTDGSLSHTVSASIDIRNVAPEILGLDDVTNESGVPTILRTLVQDPGENDIVSFLWDFGDQTNAVGADMDDSSEPPSYSVSHTYARDGIYDVSLTVMDDYGASTSATAKVSVGPAASFDQPRLEVSEGDGVVNVGISLTSPPIEDVIIPLTLLAGNPDLIYAGENGHLGDFRIPAGETAASFALTLIDDALSEDDEAIALALGMPGGFASLDPANSVMQIKVRDDEPLPVLSFTESYRKTEESAGQVLATARISEVAGRDVIVPINVMGTAEVNLDYLPVNAAIIVPEGQTTGSVVIDVIDDNLGEPNESIVIAMDESEQAILSEDPSQPIEFLLVVSTSDTPSVSFGSFGSEVREDAGATNIKVMLSNPASTEIEMPFIVSDLGGASTDDFEINQTTIHFPAGTIDSNIEVQLIDDQLVSSIIPDTRFMAEQTTAPFASPELSLQSDVSAIPVLVDIDNDQDLDLFVTESGWNTKASSFYYQNIGDQNSPNFKLVPDDQNPLSQFSGFSSHMAPVFGDLDDDGDLDALIMGNKMDDSFFLRNVGTPESPSYQAESNAFDGKDFPIDRENTNGPFYFYKTSTGVLVDMTGDGKLDFVVGIQGETLPYYASINRLKVFENVGSSAEPSFLLTDEEGFRIAQPEFPVGTYAVPAVADINQDGDFDIVVGSSDGGLQYIENTGTAGDPELVEAASVNPFADVVQQGAPRSGITAAPSFGDLNGDGFPDAIVGDSTGQLTTYLSQAGFAADPSASTSERYRETVLVELGETQDVLTGSPAKHTLTILDDDVPLVTLEAIGDQWEDAGEVPVRVSLDKPTIYDVLVPITLSRTSLSDDLNPADVTIQSKFITVEAGSLSAETSLFFQDDSDNEKRAYGDFVGNETFRLQLGVPTNSLLSDAYQEDFTVLDNDPDLLFAELRSVSEGQTVNPAVRLQYESNKPIRFEWAIDRGSSASSNDYNIVSSSGNGVIPAFTDEWVNLPTVQTIDDSLSESAESLTFNISPNVSNCWFCGFFIDDNDNPSYSIQFTKNQQSNITVQEANTQVVAQAISSIPADVDRTLRVGFDPQFKHTLRLGHEIRISTEEITIPAGQRVAEFYLTLVNDSKHEPVERAGIVLATSDSWLTETSVITVPANDTISLNGQLAIGPSDDLQFIKFEPMVGTPIGSKSQGAAPGQLNLGSLIAAPIDGIITGSTVFFDANHNGVRDFLDLNGNEIQDLGEIDEPWTVSLPDGSSLIDIPEPFDRNDDGVIDATEGQLVATGGTDLATDSQLHGVLTAPAGMYVLSPVTSVINSLVRLHGVSVIDAERRVMDALRLQYESIALVNPLDGVLNGETQAAELYKSGVAIQNIVEQSAVLLASISGSPSADAIAHLVYDRIADGLLAEGAVLDLRSIATLRSVIGGISQHLGLSLSEDWLDAAATVSAAVNRELFASSSQVPTILLDKMARIQHVGQVQLPGSLNGLADGSVTPSQVVDEYSGNELLSKISNTKAGQILPSLIVVRNADVVESDGETQLVFEVELVNATQQTISVDYVTEDYTARLDEGDYEARSGTLTWEPGDDSIQEIIVPVLGDTVFEDSEQMLLRLERATGGVIRRGIGFGEILNDDDLLYEVPDSEADTKVQLSLSPEGLLLRRNDEVIVQSDTLQTVPITINGNDSGNTTFTVSISGNALDQLPHLTFNGGALGQDSVILYEPVASETILSVLDVGNGSFNVDEWEFEFRNVVKSESGYANSFDSLPTRGIVDEVITLEGIFPADIDPQSREYQWEVLLDSQVVESSTGTNLSFTPTEIGRHVFAFSTSDPLISSKGIAIVNIPIVGSRLQNHVIREDVNNDAIVSALDALIIINAIARNDSTNGRLSVDDLPQMIDFLDVNGSGDVSALDALLVINFLGRVSTGEGEAVFFQEDIRASESINVGSAGYSKYFAFERFGAQKTMGSNAIEFLPSESVVFDDGWLNGRVNGDPSIRDNRVLAFDAVHTEPSRLIESLTARLPEMPRINPRGTDEYFRQASEGITDEESLRLLSDACIRSILSSR